MSPLESKEESETTMPLMHTSNMRHVSSAQSRAGTRTSSSLILLAILLMATRTFALTASLEYVADDASPAGVRISCATVTVAPTSAGHSPQQSPVLSFDFERLSGKGLTLSELSRISVSHDDADTTYCVVEQGRLISDAKTSTVVEGDFSFRVRYFDKAPPDTIMSIYYATRSPEGITLTHAGDLELSNTKTWREQDFTLRNASLAGPDSSGNPSRFGVIRLFARKEADWLRNFRGRMDCTTVTLPASKLPAQAGPKPVCLRMKLFENETRVLVIDRKSPGDRTPNRLWFDRNSNGSLHDDEPIATHEMLPLSREDANRLQFCGIDTSITVAGKPMPYRFSLEIPGMRDVDVAPTLSVVPSCYYRGRFTFGDRNYLIAICDENLNGRFGDGLRVDPNVKPQLGTSTLSFEAGDGLILSSTGRLSGKDSSKLVTHLVLGGKLLELRYDETACALHLDGPTCQTGTLVLPHSVDELTAVAPDAGHSVHVRDTSATEIRVPVGTYCVSSYRMSRKDSEGDTWQLGAIATTAMTTVTLTAGRKSVLPFGEPFSCTVSTRGLVTAPGSEEQMGYLEFTVLGAAGEHVNLLWRVSGNKTRIPLSAKKSIMPKEPQYVIAKPDGELVARGSFEYG